MRIYAFTEPESRLDFIENRIGIRQRGELVVCYKAVEKPFDLALSLSFYLQRSLACIAYKSLSFMRSPDSKIALNSLICAEKAPIPRSQDRYKSLRRKLPSSAVESRKAAMQTAITVSHSL